MAYVPGESRPSLPTWAVLSPVLRIQGRLRRGSYLRNGKWREERRAYHFHVLGDMLKKSKLDT